MDKALSNGYDDKLQNVYPEGKVFSNALFALSLIDYSEKQECDGQKIAFMLDKCIERLLSEKARVNFYEAMKPAYGVFYNAWVNYVLVHYQASKLYSFSSICSKIDSTQNIINQRLVAAQMSDIQLLESYPNMIWPADNLVAISSLKNDSLKTKWLQLLFTTTQHPSGLINHSDNNKSSIHGSSQAMIIYFLNQQHEESELQNNIFKELLVDNFLGVQLVKENEDGSNEASIDSGPVIFGYGASATIMNIKTQASFQDAKAKKT